MFYRLRNTGLILSLLLFSHTGSVIAHPKSGSLAPDIPVQTSSAGLPDAIADRVLGQAGFNTNGEGVSASSMWLPAGIAIAPPGVPNAGRIFVVEYGYNDGNQELGNHRVLSWPGAASFATGQAADLVIGQEDFTSGDGDTAQDRFYGPEAAVVDASGNLWVADTVNNRVLRFDYPLSNGMDASVVLGQPDYTSSDPNRGGTAAANTLYFPRGLAMDSAGNLYVADDFNHRVLRFSPPFTEFEKSASLVIGQADFDGKDPNRGNVEPGRNTLHSPKGIAIDTAGHLYVADFDNNRVTRFDPPFSDGMDATGLFGQSVYYAEDPNRGGLAGRNTLFHPIDLSVSTSGDILFVTDQGNSRLLGFSNHLEDNEGDALADQVYGQPDYTSSTPNNGGVTATSINYEPLGVAVDANGSLYHADFRNNRLLAYDPEVVGDGTPGSCTEAALDEALVAGGNIYLNCGTAQIDFTGTKLITADTTIDGEATVTLNGQFTTTHFYVNAEDALTLRNITLTNGYGEGDGGAIYNDGTLTLENATIRDSVATLSGGAIVNYGRLTIQDSLLEGNSALNGGALYPRWSGSRTIIVNSVLRNNYATDETNGWGGAILVWDGASVIIQNSDIFGNTAEQGGGIYNYTNSVLGLYGDTLLRDNIADDGGGLYNLGSAWLEGTTVSGNEVDSNAGGIYNEAYLSLEKVTLSGNTADHGGGLDSFSGTALLTNSTISGNSAQVGGGIINNSTATLTNVTISGNSASSYGGGLFNDGAATLTNNTLSNNSAPSGGGIYNDAAATATLKNSIISNSPSGGNCGGNPLTGDNSDKYSLSSDNTCALAGTGSMNGVDPLLTELGDYGGPTQVHMLKPDSPAIDGVLGSDAPSTDQRGVTRPQGGGYDIGAVEVAPDDIVKKVFLPLAIR